jgi:cholesterol transport system auxiliary component
VKKLIVFLVLSFLLAACSPIKQNITNQYTFSNYEVNKHLKKRTPYSIYISPPEAVPTYQTSSMMYTNKPHELSAFAHNAWTNPPADMLLPIITQNLQKTGYFRSVTSSTNTEHTDYRLDTQVLELRQNFLVKPSQIDLTIEELSLQIKRLGCLFKIFCGF